MHAVGCGTLDAFGVDLIDLEGQAREVAALVPQVVAQMHGLVLPGPLGQVAVDAGGRHHAPRQQRRDHQRARHAAEEDEDERDLSPAGRHGDDHRDGEEHPARAGEPDARPVRVSLWLPGRRRHRGAPIAERGSFRGSG